MRKITIVYDVDDVLNDLCDHVHSEVGTNPDDQDYFDVADCSKFSQEQKDQILSLFSNPDTFLNLNYVPGANQIMKFERYKDVEVHINSGSFNKSIADIKQNSLLKEIYDITPDRIHLQISKPSDHKMVKRIYNDATIVIDDNIKFLQDYPSSVFKILIDKPYNKATSYNITDNSEGIIRVGSLLEANRIVHEIIHRIRYDEAHDYQSVAVDKSSQL